MKNIFHDKKWKENETDLNKITERILGMIGEIWNNPAFMTSTSRSEQSEGTYVADVIIPLLRASLSDLPNGNLAGIPRYFHLDHAEIPLSSSNNISRVKSLIRVLLTLRNIMIVNKSLLVQALEQATSRLPRNINPSPTVSTPPYIK
ncbi:unnamed protein product [Rhizophagus irregularis]|nr:unnamed protein product [Rhizophagus irregularis]